MDTEAIQGGGRHWSYAAMAKKCLRPLGTRRSKLGFSSRAFGWSGEHFPTADTWPSELGESKFLLFEAPKFVGSLWLQPQETNINII